MASATGCFVFASTTVPASVAPLASFIVTAASVCGRRATRVPRRASSSCQSLRAWPIVKEPSSAVLPTGRLSTKSSAPAAGVPSSLAILPVIFTPGCSARSGDILALSRIMNSLYGAKSGWSTTTRCPHFAGSGTL
jgi:hypothetical protein